jgi:hypothetical protein
MSGWYTEIDDGHSYILYNPSFTIILYFYTTQPMKLKPHWVNLKNQEQTGTIDRLCLQKWHENKKVRNKYLTSEEGRCSCACVYISALVYYNAQWKKLAG